MIEPMIVYLLLYFALIFGAIPLANFIHHFITAFCEASHATAVGGRIRLTTGDEDQPAKPFPQWAMYLVALLSFSGVTIQVISE